MLITKSCVPDAGLTNIKIYKYLSLLPDGACTCTFVKATPFHVIDVIASDEVCPFPATIITASDKSVPMFIEFVITVDGPESVMSYIFLNDIIVLKNIF